MPKTNNQRRSLHFELMLKELPTDLLKFRISDSRRSARRLKRRPQAKVRISKEAAVARQSGPSQRFFNPPRRRIFEVAIKALHESGRTWVGIAQAPEVISQYQNSSKRKSARRRIGRTFPPQAVSTGEESLSLQHTRKCDQTVWIRFAVKTQLVLNLLDALSQYLDLLQGKRPKSS